MENSKHLISEIEFQYQFFDVQITHNYNTMDQFIKLPYPPETFHMHKTQPKIKISPARLELNQIKRKYKKQKSLIKRV